MKNRINLGPKLAGIVLSMALAKSHASMVIFYNHLGTKRALDVNADATVGDIVRASGVSEVNACFGGLLLDPELLVADSGLSSEALITFTPKLELTSIEELKQNAAEAFKYGKIELSELNKEELAYFVKIMPKMDPTSITLTNCNIGYDVAAELAMQNWVNLHTLDLSNNNIGYDGGAALAANTSWVNLNRLNLSNNKSWVNLRILDLSHNGNQIGDDMAAALANNTSWVNLNTLDLSDNNIGDRGAAELAANISWINLHELDLSGNSIGELGAAALAANTSWVNLNTLNLSYNKIGDEGAAALAANKSWRNLENLNLSYNNIGAEAAAALKHRFSEVFL